MERSLGKGVPGGGNSPREDPEAGACSVGLGNSEEACVAGGRGAKGTVRGEAGRPQGKSCGALWASRGLEILP